MRTLRLRHGRIETPITAFRHRRTGRQIIIIGTMHVGTPAYYDQLQNIISLSSTAGTSVEYEIVSHAPEEEWSAQELKAWQGFCDLYDALSDLIVKQFGWVTQKHLKYSPSWKNVDITDLQLVRLIGPENMPQEFPAVLQDDPVLAAATVSMVLRLIAADPMRLLERFSNAHNERVKAAVLDFRNAVAAKHLTPEGPPTILIWGAAHLEGIARYLRASGFRATGTEWVAVGEVPTFRQSWKSMWQSASAVNRKTK